MKKILFIAFVFMGCESKKEVIQEVFTLPKKLKEVSGMIYNDKRQVLWTLEDSGNPNALTCIDKNGKKVHEIEITNLENTDWEDITKDAAGNLYIGDFGNNDNERKDLAIYKIAATDLDQKSTKYTERIGFSYPEQTDFPPKKTALWFDLEGFFEMEGYFYLFTKNRSKKFDGMSLVYKIPNRAGDHQAELIGKFYTNNEYQHGAITSLAISPDKQKIAVLAHDKIWILEAFSSDNILKNKTKLIELNHFSQKEAICFTDNQTMWLCDENENKGGGKVYEIKLP
ncbi:hypothetical protein [Flavobacterium branchiophilum]|uniref:Uncharacterized protein n=1 Tax=Flavobacterium branchiophilum TaxID=55197 RepID=A0A2H3KGH4_9FLAO|nr:hypothetical protein [Flavobacterium branchiophilum]PDS26844.1 hypothetical protein B0A77_01110 [Flavobacterium branchiophilum]